MKPKPGAILCQGFLAFALMVVTSTGAMGDSYDFVRDQYGEPLGLDYKRDGISILGELGIFHQPRVLVFVACENQDLFVGEEFMRRRNRNCRNQRGHWPEDLMNYVAMNYVGTTVRPIKGPSNQPVVLIGTPTACGACMPSPFEDFPLPEGIEIITQEFREQIERKIQTETGFLLPELPNLRGNKIPDIPSPSILTPSILTPSIPTPSNPTPSNPSNGFGGGSGGGFGGGSGG